MPKSIKSELSQLEQGSGRKLKQNNSQIVMINTRKTIVFWVILAGLSLSVIFAVLEITSRFLRPRVTVEDLASMIDHYEPAVFARHVYAKREQSVLSYYPDPYKPKEVYYINSKGYRGRQFSATKQPGVIRIVFIGGSAVFDQMAKGRGRDWPHRVEALLKSQGFNNVECINAGIPGHASQDSFGRLFSEIHFFEPDYIVTYQAWNDIKYFSYLSPDSTILRAFKPYQKDKDPRVNYSNIIDRILCYSQFYTLVRTKYYEWKLNIGSEGISHPGPLASHYSAYGVTQYKLNLQFICDLARNIGATSVLCTQPRLVSASNSVADRNKIKYQFAELEHETLYRAFEDVIKS